MMGQIIYWVGVAVCTASGISVAALALIGCALVSNRAQNHLIDSLGGWKILLEYRDWYNQRRSQQADDSQKGGGK
jgi:hypothetical protein